MICVSSTFFRKRARAKKAAPCRKMRRTLQNAKMADSPRIVFFAERAYDKHEIQEKGSGIQSAERSCYEKNKLFLRRK